MKPVQDLRRAWHMTPPLTFLQWYNNEEEKFLGHTVTSDEAWISYSNAVTQKHSLV